MCVCVWASSFNMESNVRTDKSNNRWRVMVISIIFLLLLNTSQVESQQFITIEQSPQNATVSVGELVTLTCVFSVPVDCNWLKDDQPYRIKPEDGNTFTGDSSTGENTRDCSIRISTVTEDDFAKWRCATYASKGFTPVSSEDLWIIKRGATKADYRTPIIIAGVLGGVLIVAIVTITATLIRRKVRRKNKVSPSPLPTMAQLNASAIRGVDVSLRPRGPPARTANSSTVHLYENVSDVRRTEVDSNGYLLPRQLYEEIKGRSQQLTPGDDSGYMTLR